MLHDSEKHTETKRLLIYSRLLIPKLLVLSIRDESLFIFNFFHPSLPPKRQSQKSNRLTKSTNYLTLFTCEACNFWIQLWQKTKLCKTPHTSPDTASVMCKTTQETVTFPRTLSRHKKCILCTTVYRYKKICGDSYQQIVLNGFTTNTNLKLKGSTPDNDQG